MLPTPVSSSKKRRVFLRNHRDPTSQLDILLTRARITNLGLIVLSSFTALSFLYNLSIYFSHRQDHWYTGKPPLSILSTLSRPAATQDLDHLIIVPGHAIWKGSKPYLMKNEDEWILESYQKGEGRIFAFIDHISRGYVFVHEDFTEVHAIRWR